MSAQQEQQQQNSENAVADASTKDSWRAIESNPDVFTKFLQQTVSDKWRMVDVFSFEEEYLSFIPQPCYAFVLVFSTQHWDTAPVPESERVPAFFIRQGDSLPNACGTIAMMHAIVNNKDTLGIAPNSAISEFIARCNGKTPLEVGDIMSSFEPIRDVHNALVEEGQTDAPADNNVETKCHYLCLSQIGNDVVEFDGWLNLHPKRVMRIEEGETFTKAAIRVVKQKFDQNQNSIHFAVTALVPAEEGEAEGN